MAKSNADRQKQYRDKKRNAPVTENVTRVTKQDTVTLTDVAEQFAQDLKGGGIPIVDPYPDIGTGGPLGISSSPTPIQMQQAMDRRTNPDRLNWGDYMNADELEAYKRKYNLPTYHNRVSIPGDWDYVGVCRDTDMSGKIIGWTC